MKTLLRKIVKVLLGVLIGLFLLILIIAGGGLIWLRTPSAANFIAGAVTEQLSSQGLELQLGHISASLPQRLELKEIALSDADGIFFTASELTLRTRLGALLSGRIEIEEISLENPEAFRLPNLPPSEETPEPASSTSLGVLPFGIRIDQIAVRGGILHTAVLRLQVPPAAASPAEEPTVPENTLQEPPKPEAPPVHTPAISETDGNGSPPSVQNATDTPPEPLLPKQKGPSSVPAVLAGGQAPPFTLELSGSASLNGSTLAASLVASIQDSHNNGLRLELDLGAASALAGPQAAAPERQPAPGEENLRILLTAKEDTDGLLSILTGDPQFPHYSLELHGNGPIREWQGSLSLQAGLPDEVPSKNGTQAASGDKAPSGSSPTKNPSGLIGLEAVIGLQCHTGSLWKDLVLEQDFGFSLQTTATPGDKLDAALRNLLGQSVLVDARVAAKQGAYHIDLDTSSKAWQITVSDAFIRSSEIAAIPEMPSDTAQKSWPLEWRDAAGNVHGSGLAIDGKIAASIKDIQTLLAAGSETAAPALPLKNLSLTSSVSTLLDSGFTGARARGELTIGEVDLTQLANPNAAGESANALATRDYELSYSLQADVTDRRARIQEFLLDGLGISLELAGNADTIAGAMAVDARLRAADRSDWQSLLAQLGGFAENTLGGAVDLALNLELPGLKVNEEENSQASGKLSIQGTDMRWPSAQLANILGPSLQVGARLTGGTPGEAAGSSGQYHLVLDTLSAGIIRASGTADFFPGKDPDDNQRISLETGELSAVLEAAISDIAPLAASDTGQAAPVSGPLHASIGAKGPLKNLGLTLDISSPDIAVQGTHLRNISVKADAASSFTEDAVAGRGAISASIGQSPGGPVSLSGRWQASLPKNSPSGGTQMRAGLEGFLLRGAGVDATADLSLTLPLAVNGTVKTEIKDWKTIAALAGTPLSGGTANLNLRLANGSRGQEANLDMRLASLRVQEPGSAPSFFIRDVDTTLTASRLLDNPDLDLTLRTGRGMAGPLRWGSGNGAIKGNSGNGEFSLALLNQGSRGRSGSNNKSTASGSKNRKTTSGSEALALRGSYALGKPEVTVATFTMDNSRSKTGLRLQKPLVINLQQGVRVADLDLAFKPDGRLTADAAFAPGRLEVKAKLEKLPYSFFKLFTEANLPDGQLQANVDFKTASSGPQGSFSVQSRISATQDVSGVVAQSASAAGSVFEILLDGSLSASPGSPAVEGSGVRRLPGIVWLQGTGTLGNAGAQAQAKQGKLDFQIPLRPGSNGIPLPDSIAPMAARLYWKGEIAPLWQTIPMADRHLTGQSLIDLNIGGSMKAPKLLVSAFMANGRFEDIPNGLLISGITLEARNTPEGDVRALVSAHDQQSGDLAVEANLTGVSGQGNAKPQLALRGQLDKFSPLHRDDLSIALSGIFGLNGPLDALKVTSQIVVNHGELNIASNLGSSVPTLDVVNKKRTDTQEAPAEEEEVVAGGGPVLDIHILIPRYFYIRGKGLDSEWEGDLRINGNASSPSLRGSLKPVRGYLDLLSKTFTVSEGEITFTEGMNLNPALDLLLTYEGPSITAFARAGGSAKKPKFTLESRPPLPQDEVLAMVLFGKRTSDLSRFEAIQLANSLRELSGFGGSGLDVLTGVRKSVGLDMLRIGGSEGKEQRTTSGQAGEGNLGAPKANGSSDAAGTPTLEAGKYINDSIYVGVEQGATPESTAVRVEIELYPSISLEGKSTSESSEVGIGWKMDY